MRTKIYLTEHIKALETIREDLLFSEALLRIIDNGAANLYGVDAKKVALMIQEAKAHD